MITTSHLLLNLAVLNKQNKSSLAAILVVAAGALLPDAAMFVFYALEKLRGVPESVIWGEHYYLPGWQAVFDVFNSLPIIAAIGLVGWWRKSRLLLLLCASMALHVALDLPLHHDDGHRHFWPLSDWRFVSPVSYWDPQHHGKIMQPLEMLVALVCGIFLLRAYQHRAARILIAVLLLSYLVFIGYALVVWSA